MFDEEKNKNYVEKPFDLAYDPFATPQMSTLSLLGVLISVILLIVVIFTGLPAFLVFVPIIMLIGLLISAAAKGSKNSKQYASFKNYRGEIKTLVEKEFNVELSDQEATELATGAHIIKKDDNKISAKEYYIEVEDDTLMVFAYENIVTNIEAERIIENNSPKANTDDE